MHKVYAGHSTAGLENVEIINARFIQAWQAWKK